MTKIPTETNSSFVEMRPSFEREGEDGVEHNATLALRSSTLRPQLKLLRDLVNFR